MASQNGIVYNLVCLFPLLVEPAVGSSHSEQLRSYLRNLQQNGFNPFTTLPGVHNLRIVMLDGFQYPGFPSRLDTLPTTYLLFVVNVDGPLDIFLNHLSGVAGDAITAIWQHCKGFAELSSSFDLVNYFKDAQISSGLFFADQPYATVTEVRHALQLQRGLSEFIAAASLLGKGERKVAFNEFVGRQSVTLDLGKA
jgi:hypothetical protein